MLRSDANRPGISAPLHTLGTPVMAYDSWGAVSFARSQSSVRERRFYGRKHTNCDSERTSTRRRTRTKVRNSVRLGVSLGIAITHVVSRKSYWRLSRTPAMRYAMPNRWLEQPGLLSLKQLWYDLAPLRGIA